MRYGKTLNSRLVLMALAVGVFFTAEEVFMDRASGRAALTQRDIVNGAEFWAIWLALVPAIAIAVRRWPLNGSRVTRALAAHAATALALAVVHNLIGYATDSLVAYAHAGGSLVHSFDRAVISQAFVWGVFTGVVFYAVVLMLHTALAFRAELAQAKLDTLRAQLRPHFLFNTLNAISVFVGEDTAKARSMILRLAALLRRSLDQDRHEVPLAEELAFALDYLDIQRGRFGDRLTVDLDVAPNALRGNVPVFLLQPLLENAIEHGMPDERSITVIVRASRLADGLRVAVIDDGTGLVAEAARRGGNGAGIGITNTRARLEQLYGAAAGVEWRPAGEQADATGTHVEIRLPYRESLA